MAYASSSEYNKYQSCSCEDSSSCTCNSGCSSCPIGTVEVKDADGCSLGCMTPSDAAQYFEDTLDVPEGYVKAFDPNTGAYVGLLTPSELCAYLTCIGSGADTFHIVSPRNDTTYAVDAFSINSTDGNNLSGDQTFWADRNGYTGVISLDIVSTDGIEFLSGGVSISIPANQSVVRDEFEKPGTALTTGSYDITLQWKKADGTVVRSQTITFIVP